jgi:hypothetical protein
MATGLKMQEENILGSYLDLYGVSCGFWHCALLEEVSYISEEQMRCELIQETVGRNSIVEKRVGEWKEQRPLSGPEETKTVMRKAIWGCRLWTHRVYMVGFQELLRQKPSSLFMSLGWCPASVTFVMICFMCLSLLAKMLLSC